MQKFRYPILAVLSIVVLYFVFKPKSEEKKELIVQPKFGDFEVAVTTTGELKAKRSMAVRGPDGARKINVYNMKILQLIPEGTVVKKGDFVAELDKSEVNGKLQDAMLQLQKIQSQVEQARIDSTLSLGQSRDELVNLKFSLEEKKLVMEQSKFESPSVQRQAEIDYDRTLRQYEQAVKNYTVKVRQSEAKIREVETDLQKEQNKIKDIESIQREFTIMAPESGMIIYRREWNGSKRTVGANVSPWDPVVAELPDLTEFQSITYVNEVDIQKIREGQLVRVGLDAMADKKLTGKVLSVANIGEQRPNSDSKVFEVMIAVNESDTLLRPAMTTSNKIVISTSKDALFIPLEALHSFKDMRFVYKKEGLSTVRQEVRLGAMNEDEIIILDGLKQDDKLLLSLPADTTGFKTYRITPALVSGS